MCFFVRFTHKSEEKQAKIAKISHFWGHQKNLMLDTFPKNGAKHEKFHFSFKNYLNSGHMDFGTSKHISGFRNQNHFKKSAQTSANWGGVKPVPLS